MILSHYLRQLMRVVFKNTMGRRVNHKSRQMTPTEYLQFQSEMDERERREKRKGSSVNEIMDKTKL